MQLKKVTAVEVVSIAPIYPINGGIGSHIGLADGSEYDVNFASRTVMRHLLEHHGMDLEKYRKMFCRDWTSKQNVPVIIGQLGFMTCKMQHALWHGAPVYGYVRLDAIDRMVQEDGVGVVYLKGEKKIRTEQSLEALRQHYHLGVSALHVYATRWAEVAPNIAKRKSHMDRYAFADQFVKDTTENLIEDPATGEVTMSMKVEDLMRFVKWLRHLGD